MSDNNLHRIFAETTCISTELMIDYLNGQLSEKEKNAVEVHLSSCEMCRDEFEGLSLLENKSKLPLLVADLDSKIDQKTAQPLKKTFTLKPIHKLAAVLIILLTSAWFITFYVDSSAPNMNDEMVSQSLENEKSETEIMESEKSLLEEDTLSLDQPDSQSKKLQAGKETIAKSKLKTAEQKLEKEKEAVQEKEIEGIDPVMDEKISVTEYTASSEITPPVNEIKVEEDKVKTELSKDQVSGISIEKQKRDENAVALEESVDDFNDELNNTGVTDNQSSVSRSQTGRKKLAKAEQNQSDYPSTLNTVFVKNFNLAMAEYNRRDYKNAIDLFKKSLNEHSKQDEVYYYLAKSYNYIDDTENALRNYNKVIAEVQSPYYEDALWDKSNLLLSINKKKSAVNALNQLKEYKGKFAKKATHVLDSINKPVIIEENK